ncbi:MAG: hypothetical protein AAF270_11045 [Pseudomonadota bacterium]
MTEKKNSRLELGTSLLAIAISVVAMGVSLFEVSAMRSQQRAEVWPYIELSQRFNNEGFELQLSNKGVGPALMADVNLTNDGQAITDLDAFIAATVGDENAFSYDVYRVGDPANRVIAAGEQVTLFAVPWEPRTRLLIERWGAQSIDIVACYCSIHEECWRAKMSERQSQPAERCR